MKKPFFYKLPSTRTSKVSEEAPGDYAEMEYTPASFAAAWGTEEWFLTYTIQPNGVIEGLNESSTYSISLSPNGKASIKNYTLTKNRETGKLSTIEDSQQGEWGISKQLLTIELADETLEFIVTRIEHGVAQLIDPDFHTVSVFMTEAAFKVAVNHLIDL